MLNQWSFLLSVLFHSLILFSLVNKPVKPEQKIALQTNLVFKSKKPKDLLPKKITPVYEEPLPTPKIIKKPKENYKDILKNLSQDFKKDTEQHEYEDEKDNSYYDQIYTLIKQSFIVPPHIIGPKGDGLVALVKIFLDIDGELLKVEINKASSDDHFNKAVLDGINRVHNFGRPPVFLRKSLLKEGIIVELCPNKCPKH